MNGESACGGVTAWTWPLTTLQAAVYSGRSLLKPPTCWKETLRGLVRGRLPAELRGAKHQKAVDLHQPDGPHWYLHDIATSPDVRGQGIGSALLRRRLALIDAQPAPVFLEATTDASRRLYERYGFSVVAEVSTLPETLSYAMIREAV